MLQKIKPSVVPGITWLLLSTILLVLPGSSLPKEEWLSKIWFDKWVHVGMFAILVFLWCWSSLPRYSIAANRKKVFIRVAVIAVLYGIAMEFIQKYFVPNRSFDFGDILADALGSFLGLLYSGRRYIKK